MDYFTVIALEKKNSNNTRRKRLVRAEREGNYSPYHTQNEEKLMDLLTVQSVKTVLHYLQETNGEMHFYLNNYIYENPFGKTYKNSRATDERIWGGMVDQFGQFGLNNGDKPHAGICSYDRRLAAKNERD